MMLDALLSNFLWYRRARVGGRGTPLCEGPLDDGPPDHCRYCFGLHGADLALCPKPTRFEVIPHISAHDWPVSVVREPVWQCEDCFLRFKREKQNAIDRYNNTVEAARMVFHEEDGEITYSYAEIDADFEVTFESLSPYVRAAIDASDEWDDLGIEFKALVIREGKVSILS